MVVLPPFWIWQSHVVARRPIRHFSPVKVDNITKPARTRRNPWHIHDVKRRSTGDKAFSIRYHSCRYNVLFLSILIKKSFWTFNWAVAVESVNYLRKSDWNLGRGTFFHSGREGVEMQPFPLLRKWMEDYRDWTEMCVDQIKFRLFQQREDNSGSSIFWNVTMHWEEKDWPSYR